MELGSLLSIFSVFVSLIDKRYLHCLNHKFHQNRQLKTCVLFNEYFIDKCNVFILIDEQI